MINYFSWLRSWSKMVTNRPNCQGFP